MWAYTQHDGHPQNIGGAHENDKEWKFHNSIPWTTPQTLADDYCSSAVQ